MIYQLRQQLDKARQEGATGLCVGARLICVTVHEDILHSSNYSKILEDTKAFPSLQSRLPSVNL